MKVFFRVDSNRVISGGHVARCLSLAGSFAEAGYECVFASSDTVPAAAVGAAGFAHVEVGGDWRDLGSDGGALRRLLEREDGPLLVVDSYSIDRGFVEDVKRCSKVCYLGSKLGYLGPLDALVNYSTDIDCEYYSGVYGSDGTALLLGPGYAPLREQFQGLAPIDVAPRVKRVLVSTGGTDPLGMAELATAAVLVAAGPGLEEAVVLVGSMSGAREALERRFGGDRRVRLASGVADMAGLMRSCDLAVSANGTTVYELAACGVPAVTFAMVEEQRASGEGLSRLRAVEYCGCAADGMAACLERIAASVASCCGDAAVRRRLQRRSRGLVDGNGAPRIVERLGRELGFGGARR